MTLVDELGYKARAKRRMEYCYREARDYYEEMRKWGASLRTAHIREMPEMPHADETAEYTAVIDSYKKRNGLIEKAINEEAYFSDIVDDLSKKYRGWRLFLPVLRYGAKTSLRETDFDELEEVFPVYFLKPSCTKCSLKDKLNAVFEDFVYYNPLSWAIGYFLLQESLFWMIGLPSEIPIKRALYMLEISASIGVAYAGLAQKKNTLDGIMHDAKYLDSIIKKCYKEKDTTDFSMRWQ